jgi:hypothetical protein
MHMVFLFLWHMDCRRGISILLCLALAWLGVHYFHLLFPKRRCWRAETAGSRAKRLRQSRSHRACSVAWLAEHTTKQRVP